MMRALFAGVSGLRNHQTRMDVIGNNIANVNTVAFKASRVTFKEAFAQLLQGASRPPGNTGGTNPIQIGSGMNIGSIDQLFTQGSLETTGQNTDLAIQGDSFFVLSDGQKQVYTRAGNFQLDAEGRLIASNNGFVVQGINADSLGNFSAASAITDIRLPLGQKSPAQATTRISLTGNLDQNAATAGAQISSNPNTLLAAPVVTSAVVTGTYALTHTAAGQVTLTAPDGTTQTLTGVADGAQTLNFNALGVSFDVGAGFLADPAASGGSGSIDGASLSVTAAATHDMGITVYDGAGAPHNLQLTFTKQPGTGAWSWTASIGGTPPTATIASGGSGTVSFSPTGSLAGFTGGSPLVITPANGAAFEVTLDPGTVNQINGLAGFAKQSNAVISGQNGYQAGDLTDISIDNNGVVTGFFTNGVSRSLAQIALAKFNNPSGLLRNGDNVYAESANSGLAVLGFAGISDTSSITPGALENSNVDISTEFTNMIITQRGFQANSKVITTADEMLSDVVNLKR
ncbi:MAG TPA: flagellar hook protein FlgE [Gemmatimonadales bacterium]|nr:flagellar hook protein FlgE [Gemmatimonadales bacterium]